MNLKLTADKKFQRFV